MISIIDQSIGHYRSINRKKETVSGCLSGKCFVSKIYLEPTQLTIKSTSQVFKWLVLLLRPSHRRRKIQQARSRTLSTAVTPECKWTLSCGDNSHLPERSKLKAHVHQKTADKSLIHHSQRLNTGPNIVTRPAGKSEYYLAVKRNMVDID